MGRILWTLLVLVLAAWPFLVLAGAYGKPISAACVGMLAAIAITNIWRRS